MTRTLDADVLIIGFGKAGRTVAGAMGRLGRRVVLVEQSDRMYGGTCPNVGCVPTKALVHHSGNRRPTDSPQEFYERSVGVVQAVREMMRTGNYDALNNADTVTVVDGRAVFTDPHTVTVGDGEDQLTITGEHILINTGSEPIVPAIPGLADSRYRLSSTELIENTRLPKRLAIVGGGYLGLEFAAIYQRFGAEVTVFEESPAILGHEDEDIAAVAREILAGEGMDVVTSATVTEVRDGADSATVGYTQDGAALTRTFDAVLAATGRAPATHGLGLDAAGVRTTRNGAVEVDEYLRTSQPHIFGVGDVNGGPQFTYISLDDARIVIDQLAGRGQRTTTDRVAIPRVLFMTPPLATVGLTEREARAAGYSVKVGRELVGDIIAMPRAYAVEETRGMMKFVIDLETDLILGAALLSLDSQEMINTVALAMRHEVTATELTNAVYTHPSTTEALNEVLSTVVASDEPVAVTA